MFESGPAPYARTKKRRVLFLGVGGGVLIFIAFWSFVLWQEVFLKQYTEITFFDVGQGDAIFIETAKGYQVLIDGGPDDSILKKLEQAMAPSDKTIDLVLLSHPASDHVTGLLSVLKEYAVKQVVWTGVQKDTKVFRQWLEVLEQEQREGAQVSLIASGIRIQLGESPCPQYLDILFPLEDLSETLVKDDNDTSIIAKGVFCNRSALFTGDITAKGEKLLLETGSSLKSDILKVAHHGSKTSSTPAFLEAVAPAYAVIQSGKDNQYGHPHEVVLERLQGYGIQVMRNDELGDIVFKLKSKN
ncbi:MAG: MBL fold metallo-hydrolase [Candidatus Wildermuthbacteria bacterium]|nr:MBL fold metallo-hydrolase [Candidatus Wildermuthbacteria bacterium]